MVFFGQEILIAPAAIQADVEVSQMFSLLSPVTFLILAKLHDLVIPFY